MTSTKARAAPRLSSSRLTLVMTAWASESWATAEATRRGSSKSMGSGFPLGTAQKPQRRVQRWPSIMKVADFWFQHSPRLGQFALSQTVCRLRSRASFLRAWKVSPPGARALSHSGLRAGRRGERSIWMRSELRDSAVGGVISFDCIALNPRLRIDPPCFVLFPEEWRLPEQNTGILPLRAAQGQNDNP